MVFGDDVMDINKGLNVKILKLSYFDNLSV